MKKILVDFSHVDKFCGFGEIGRNYAAKLAGREHGDIRFIYLVPESWRGRFGDGVDYVSLENFETDIRTAGNDIALWHYTDQMIRYSKHCVTPGAKKLMTIHDLNFLHEKTWPHTWRHKFELSRFLKTIDAIAVISHFTKAEVERAFNVKDKQPTVIYNGVADLELLPEKRPDFVADDNELFFFTVGEIRPKKNFHSLVPMMELLPEYKLYICGNDRWSYADSIRKAIKPSDEGRIRVVGKISEENKRWLYRHCAAFMFPCLLEGFGLPVLEAMRYKTKVFTSRHTCLPEICGPHASYWDDFSPEHMAEVVRDGMARYSRQSKEAEDAYEYSKSFSYDRYVDRYLDLYRRILAE